MRVVREWEWEHIISYGECTAISVEVAGSLYLWICAKSCRSNYPLFFLKIKNSRSCGTRLIAIAKCMRHSRQHQTRGRDSLSLSFFFSLFLVLSTATFELSYRVRILKRWVYYLSNPFFERIVDTDRHRSIPSHCVTLATKYEAHSVAIAPCSLGSRDKPRKKVHLYMAMSRPRQTCVERAEISQIGKKKKQPSKKTDWLTPYPVCIMFYLVSSRQNPMQRLAVRNTKKKQ